MIAGRCQVGEGTSAEPLHRLLEQAEGAGNRRRPAAAHRHGVEAVGSERRRRETERQGAGTVEGDGRLTGFDDDQERVAADAG